MTKSKNIFTFATLTYNHEKVIVEHLESIKFQIIKFGSNYSNEIIIIDDNSTDSTVNIIRRWKAMNTELNIKIISNDHNIGINANYLKLIDNINSQNFKILAGDDVYGPYSIFEINDLNRIKFSPVVKLDNEKMYIQRNHLLHFKYNFSNYSFQKKLRLGNLISAPGVFFGDIKIFSNNYLSYQKEFKYFEDYPSWVYFFLINDTKYRFINTPYVIHRVGHEKIYSNKLEIVDKRADSDNQKLKQLINIESQKRNLFSLISILQIIGVILNIIIIIPIIFLNIFHVYRFKVYYKIIRTRSCKFENKL